MRNPDYSSIDSRTGNVTWKGPLSIEKGDHTHMPRRSDSYLPGDERGHVNASSLGGTNTSQNVVPQNADVNHGAYYQMERGERAALKNGASIDSTKTAIVNGQPGDRPEVFLVNDHITYTDGPTEDIHQSFTNASYADQQSWNDQTAALPGVYDAPNPGDGLRDSMSTAEYAELMESTDAELPSIAEEYTASDFSGLPGADSTTDSTADVDYSESDISTDADTSSGDGIGTDCDVDD